MPLLCKKSQSGCYEIWQVYFEDAPPTFGLCSGIDTATYDSISTSFQIRRRVRSDELEFHGIIVNEIRNFAKRATDRDPVSSSPWI